MTLSYPLLLAICRLASASSGCACANGWMMETLICWKRWRITSWVLWCFMSRFQGKWCKCLQMFMLIFGVSSFIFNCFRWYIHVFLIGSFQGSKKKNGRCIFSPHPTWPWKFSHWPHSENQDLSETTIGNYTTKGPSKAQQKNDKNPVSQLSPTQAIEIQHDGIWKKWKNIITPQAFFHLLSSRPGTGNMCIYFRVKRLKMCGLCSVFGVDSN